MDLDSEIIRDDYSQIFWQPSEITSTGNTKSIVDQAKEQLQTENKFPTFLAHVFSLEKNLRLTETVFIDEYISAFNDRSFVGRGATFSVERAVAIPNPQTISSAPEQIRQRRVVALKTVRIESKFSGQPKTGWRHVLLEIRTLLHATLRYHPNIARLLGLCWGSNGASTDVYPQLVVEMAEHGTLEDLQSRSERLPFAIKQKLLYDAGKGLSIIHACNIIHGDIKRKNVLIFTNDSPNPKHGPFTAKLADFGGAVVGSAKDDSYRLICKQQEYAAPEANELVTAKGAKLCDVYSFGLLICETFVDGNLSSIHPDFARRLSRRDLHQDSMSSPATLSELKASGKVLDKAITLGREYFLEHKLDAGCDHLIHFVLHQTLQKNPADRSLVKAQVALRGTPISEVGSFLSTVKDMNQKWEAVQKSHPPGKHGISVDGVGLILGAMGGTYDPQNNTPGFRPEVIAPESPDFVFEPEKLKKILSWYQQQHIKTELRTMSDAGDTGSDVELKKEIASYFLFRCHIAEFGTRLDPQEACGALRRAAFNAIYVGEDGDSIDGFEHLAASCVWRVSQALGRTPPVLLEVLDLIFIWVTLRGGWQGSQDLEDASPLLSEEQRAKVNDAYLNARHVVRTFGGAPGSLAFLHRYLDKDFDTYNVEDLQQQLKEELGSAYLGSLKVSPSTANGQGSTADEIQHNAFDQIFVNQRGHGVLHLAAARGHKEGIQYIADTFKLDIDLPNQDCEEAPLICACRNGHYEAAISLLTCGANPMGHPLGQETPLHWLHVFEEESMRPMAQALLEAGAEIDAISGEMRADVRKAHSDWEGIMSIPTTPLGRCVLFQNIHAARMLFELGADPEYEANGVSPIQLSAVLALPKFLRLFLSRGGQSNLTLFNGFEDLTLLTMAHGTTLSLDTLSLHSRLLRNGPRYRSDVEEIFNIFHEQRTFSKIPRPLTGQVGDALCMEIRLGNHDIVEILLQMGHDPCGSLNQRPMREAILVNDEAIFRMLRNHGGQIENYPESPSTLLHNLATRPPSSPPGIAIANELISAGVSVLDHPPGTRPPVVEAILREYYDLANLLIQHGAQIGCPYQLGLGYPRISIFKELVEQRTQMSLSALRALLGVSESPGSQGATLIHDEKFDFIVDNIGDPVEQRTILHVLSSSMPARNSVIESEVYGSQVQCILSENSPFALKDCLDFQHSKFSTALCLSVLLQNSYLVGRLLLKGADPSIGADLTRLGEFLAARTLRFSFRDGSPIQLALGYYEASVRAFESDGPITNSDLEDMQAVVEKLESIPDYPESAIKQLQELTRRRTLQEKTLSVVQGLSQLLPTPQQRPVDLSSMDEQKVPDLEEAKIDMFRYSNFWIETLFDRQWYGTLSRQDLEDIRKEMGE
ncbi:hypothetical protein EDB81DRAFT_871254 [Dactylonectria macrodidyma]|uniref:Protein kinase domain-containing protein n=1 Tax=Dactylonectria macrodidyma TaxID=307937 RepID=A0A9P9EAJ6_9HYPO|nr:hypothetical protein EDB81DRAFT_871254 [Dactylonectria macrodidyma]